MAEVKETVCKVFALQGFHASRSSWRAQPGTQPNTKSTSVK